MQIANNFTKIPVELQQFRQWLVWRYEDRQATKPTKVPYCAATGRLADVTDPTTWCSFDEAVAAASLSDTRYDGIGFVLTKHDPFVFIDLDQTTKDVDAQRHIKIFQEMDSYSERSPSGTGLHIIVKGSIPQGRRRSSIEVYGDSRYMTMTGSVFHDKPIEDRQELLHILWSQMGNGAAASTYIGDAPETLNDDQVREKALNAANSVKFRDLLEGRWEGYYASQSEADFAFIDIVAFYTQNREQIARIFGASALGERPKAKRIDYVSRMIYRAFDNMLPPIDIIEIQDRTAAICAATPNISGGTPQDDTEIDIEGNLFVEKLHAFWKPRPITPPEGLVGDIARYMYDSAVRPVAEVSILSALGLMAGMCGRAYNISGTGLNLYLLMLAKTGVGKEQVSSGISRLIGAVSQPMPNAVCVPSAVNFLGPSQMASGQAILKHISDPNKRSFVSVVGEFGLKMQQLASPRVANHEIMLKSVLLDLFNKSGKGDVVQGSAYSQAEKCIDAVPNPAVSILGETTPSTFYAALNEGLIADGLLPRFIILEYKGKRPPRNRDHEKHKTPPLSLLEKLATLADYSLKLQREDRIITVGCTSDALAFLDSVDEIADELMNATDADVLLHLWNRAHLKTLKLAAICAVGVHMTHPVITLEMAQWAYNVVSADIITLATRFSNGEIGKNTEELEQERAVIRACMQYLQTPYAKLSGYNIPISMHSSRLIPHSYLSRRVSQLACFRSARNGGTRALSDILRALCDMGDLQEMGKGQLLTQYKFSGRAFVIPQPEKFVTRNDETNTRD